MTVDQVKKAREFFGTDELFVFCSDAVFYDHRADNSTLVWDDEDQILYSFRTNTAYHLEGVIMDVRAINYDIIEYISNVTDMQETKDLYIKLRGHMTEEKYNKAIAQLEALDPYYIYDQAQVQK